MHNPSFIQTASQQLITATRSLSTFVTCTPLTPTCTCPALQLHSRNKLQTCAARSSCSPEHVATSNGTAKRRQKAASARQRPALTCPPTTGLTPQPPLRAPDSNNTLPPRQWPRQACQTWQPAPGGRARAQETMPPLSAEALGVAARAWRAAATALLRARELGGAPGDASTSARRLARSARASRAPTSRSSASCRGGVRGGVGRGPAPNPKQVPVCSHSWQARAGRGQLLCASPRRAGAGRSAVPAPHLAPARDAAGPARRAPAGPAAAAARAAGSGAGRAPARRRSGPRTPPAARPPRPAARQPPRPVRPGGPSPAPPRTRRPPRAPAEICAARGAGVTGAVPRPAQGTAVGTRLERAICAQHLRRSACMPGRAASGPALRQRTARPALTPDAACARLLAPCRLHAQQRPDARRSQQHARREQQSRPRRRARAAHCWKPAGGCDAAAMSASSRRSACRHMRRTAGSTWPAAPRSRPSSATSSVPPGACRPRARVTALGKQAPCRCRGLRRERRGRKVAPTSRPAGPSATRPCSLLQHAGPGLQQRGRQLVQRQRQQQRIIGALQVARLARLLARRAAAAAGRRTARGGRGRRRRGRRAGPVPVGRQQRVHARHHLRHHLRASLP